MTRELEKQIKVLKDVEDIKKLTFRYGYYLDELRTDDLVELFSNDAILDLRPILPDTIDGREAISRYYVENKSVMTRHQFMNPIIDVNGDKATGIWYLFGPATFGSPDGDTAIWMQGRYDVEYSREGKDWKISLFKYTLTFACPYENGWLKKN